MKINAITYKVIDDLFTLILTACVIYIYDDDSLNFQNLYTCSILNFPQFTFL